MTVARNHKRRPKKSGKNDENALWTTKGIKKGETRQQVDNTSRPEYVYSSFFVVDNGRRGKCLITLPLTTATTTSYCCWLIVDSHFDPDRQPVLVDWQD